MASSKKESKKETKQLAKKVVNHKKTSAAKTKTPKTEKKVTTSNEKTQFSVGMENKKIKSGKFSIMLTIIGILACMGCVYSDTLNGTYNNMPLYAILLFIILVEDKK